MSLLVRLATGDGDILDLGVRADQFTVGIISQGKNPGEGPCEKSCCWLSNCYMLKLSRIRPRVFAKNQPEVSLQQDSGHALSLLVSSRLSNCFFSCW